MKPGVSPRLRFVFAWPVLAAAGVASTLLGLMLAVPQPSPAAALALAAAGLLVVLAVSGWLYRELAQPLADLVEGAAGLAAGRLADKVAVPRQAELQSLARSLNLLAGEIEAQTELLAAERSGPEAERQAEIRRDLVANVSHELKTPLTAIRGYAETLEDGALDSPEHARRFTRSILEQCARLEILLGDLLTLSRMERPQDSGVREAVDLAESAHRAIDVLSPQARARRVELSLQVEEDLPTVRGDPEQLERLLLNLIENAVKYNRPGGAVRVRLLAGAAEVVIEVEDGGIGIPDDALERIFERFYRVDKGRSRDQGGTGLGLSIVKHAVRAHRGRVEVESRLGKGSLFRVALPRQRSGDLDAPEG